MKTLKFLRTEYPNKNWRAVRDGFGWKYETSDGWVADWRAVLAPRYPDDDYTYTSHLYLHIPGKPSEVIFANLI